MSPPAAPPFDDSRRLTGPNLYFAGTGAVLETGVGAPVAPALLEAWRQRIARARAALGWPDGPVLVREHATGASLAFTAPADALYAATEVNEWAWLSALATAGLDAGEAPLQPGHPPLGDDAAALRLLRAVAAAEHLPRLAALREGAAVHALPLLLDDEQLSIGMGTGSRTWDNHALPLPDAVPWPDLHPIPVALVTGSNGKTTSVRLLTAIAMTHGWHTANSCTDGLYLDGVLIEDGDYSGPGGARALLRNRQAQAAILETARGGMLRRGLGMERADVALVTNVSPDHFGEYGIHDLDGLAEVKLTVARAILDGTVVLNADNALLRAHAAQVAAPLAWFSTDDGHPLLLQARADGRRSCGVRDGRLLLHDGVRAHDLGDIAGMPLTLGGLATHNVQNCAGAALAASCLGIAPDTIAGVLARFGSAHGDNPGRLQRWRLGGGVQAYVDYAHNPDGLQHLLELVRGAHPAGGRLHLLLGQAGNRSDAAIAELAATAAAFRPDRVVLKDMDSAYIRGRERGEVAALLRTALLQGGVPADAMEECLDEAEAARLVLAHAGPGDSLVLPVHGGGNRARVVALLDQLQAQGWTPGDALPAPAPPG